MLISNSSVVRKALGFVAAAVVAAAWHVTASGQATLNITFPDRIAAGPDFATDVLKDPWDFSNAADVGIDPDETANWTNFSVTGGRAGGTASTDDTTLSLLSTGHYTVNNPGKMGANFPIDTSKFRKLAFRMSASVVGNDPQIYWFHVPYGDPTEAFDPACGPRNCGVTVTSKTINGTKTFVADLTSMLGGTPWTSGVVRGLRLDPNNTPAPAFGPTGAGQDFFYDWVRLTYADNAPGSAMQTIQWTGGSGATTIDVYNGDNTVLILNLGVTAAGATSFAWNTGVLPPGAYTLRMSRTGATGTKAFTINTPPSVTVTDPSRTSGQDFATAVLGNAWDMSGSEDIVLFGSENISGLTYTNPVGQLTASNTNADPNIMPLHNSNNGNGTKLIDTNKYHYLTYRMQVDGPYDLANGSVARILWTSSMFLNFGNGTTTKDIFVWPGMNSYTLDLATLTTAPNGGLETGGAPEAWTAQNKTTLRLDPHEFGSNPGDPMPTRAFHIDDIKLTATPVAAGSYTIHFAAADADAGDTPTVSLFRDVDLNPDNGNATLIQGGLAASGGSYVWNTAGTGVPDGTYYIYAVATDGVQTSANYSDAPVIVSAPCTYGLTPTSNSVANSGGSASFSITTASTCDWSAASNASFITITSALAGTGSGTISYTVAPNPARTARTGTVTAGGQTFTVTQLATRGPFDFDGDGRADRTVFSPGSGTWSTENGPTRQYGLPGDLPVPGDYDGNGVLDTAVFRPSGGDWFVQGQVPFNWGRPGDVPVPADYNGDGATDAAIFRTVDGVGGVFYVRNQFVHSFGLRGDIPLAADFDGDGKADLAVYRPASGHWFLTFSASSFTTTATYQWGLPGDVPVTGDFDGDGKADLTVYRPWSGEWFIAFSNAAPAYSATARYVWGEPGDAPLALDMDGDRVDDLVVYRRSNATWWTLNRVTSVSGGVQYGASGDVAALERPQFHAAPTADFDGDHRADVSVFRPSTGEWFTRFSSSNYATSSVRQWGLNGDVKVPGDYDGDGRTDVAVYRPGGGMWHLLFSSTGFGTSLAVQWGLSDDIPVPADYDGDGSTDLAIFRPSSGEWYVRLSASDYTTFQVDQFGLPGDIPAPADYDGDGKADLAVFRPPSGNWYLKLSSGTAGGVVVKQFGLPGDVPVASDWDGDGRADLAVYRPSTSTWFGADALTDIRYADRVLGESGDVPLAHDFDGDGVMDSAVWHPATGQWTWRLSSSGSTFTLQWGLPADKPLLRVGG